MTLPNQQIDRRSRLACMALMLLFVGCKTLSPGRLAPGISLLPEVCAPEVPVDEVPVDEAPADDAPPAAETEAYGSPEPQLPVIDQVNFEVPINNPLLNNEGLIYVPGETTKTGTTDSGRYVARQVPSNYQPPPAYQPPSIPSIPQSAPITTIPAPAPSNSGVLPPPSPTAQIPGSQYQSPQYQGPQYQNPPMPLNAPANPGVAQPLPPPNYQGQPIPGQPIPGQPIPRDGQGLPLNPYYGAPASGPVYIPNTQYADLELTGVPARTGRIMVGGSVNSDAGVMGQITLDERNFDITRWPTSFQDLASGTAFRGAGQTFRIEAVPGSQFQRYMVNFVEPNLFGFLPISLGVSGFLYDRRYQDWDEQRLGGRVALGYRVTPELSLSAGITGQQVEISRPRVTGIPELDSVVGENELYTPEFKLTHDNRDSPFQPTEGHFFEFSYEPNFGDFDFGRFDIENRNYLLLAERADGSGKQTISLTTRLGFSGEETPIFENYFAGGYSTMRGFDFRGANPVIDGVQVGGRFQWLNTVEYMFPITADDAFRGVAFVDFGTVERDIDVTEENFRVAPGLGLRIAIPMLGPAPLAFDFAYPVAQADTDERRIFSFYMSALR
jgi:outer membrane protein insertion porin family